MFEKQSLRQKILKVRDSIPYEIKRSKNEQIFRNLLSLKTFTDSQSILCYASFGSEVDTSSVINYCLKNNIILSLPKIVMETTTLEIYRIEGLHELRIGTFKIPQPTVLDNSRRLEVKDIDLVIVPGIVFDLNKNRVGFGKGYYDRLLTTTKSHKIALCYEEQIVEHIPTQCHDVKMDNIITDKRIING